MPTIMSAKTIAENALRIIGAFPASMRQADPGELSNALVWLELVINNQVGIRPMAGFWRTVDIPLEEGIGDYFMADYVDLAEVQHIFSVNVVDAQNGSVQPVDIQWENDGIEENLTQRGLPRRAVISKDVKPVLSVYPAPTKVEEDAGYFLRIRIQTYQGAIDHTGIADNELLIRPSWYLWLIKRLAYETGLGPVRRLAEGELKRLKEDADEIERLLLARDGQYDNKRPPVTEPMPGSLL